MDVLKKGDLTGVGDILAKLEKTTNLGDTLEKSRIWAEWEGIAGEEMARHCRPRTVKEGQLRIEADSAVWMHRVNYRKWNLIKGINRRLGKALVSDIFVELIADGEAIDEDE